MRGPALAGKANDERSQKAFDHQARVQDRTIARDRAGVVERPECYAGKSEEGADRKKIRKGISQRLIGGEGRAGFESQRARRSTVGFAHHDVDAAEDDHGIRHGMSEARFFEDR